jgi:polyisoprenoid-binding protein YceI
MEVKAGEFAALQGSSRWIVTPAHTRLEVHGWGPAVGEQVFTFRQFRAHIATERTTASFRADLDVRTIEGGVAGMASLARDEMLEADRFPIATFIGTAWRREGTDVCAVKGALQLHGITRELTFEGRILQVGDVIRFEATFDMPRKAFDVRLHNPFDVLVPDDVRIVLDVRAEREHVYAEEIDDR